MSSSVLQAACLGPISADRGVRSALFLSLEPTGAVLRRSVHNMRMLLSVNIYRLAFFFRRWRFECTFSRSSELFRTPGDT